MQKLSEISRIIPRPYLDLPTPMGQSDSSLYSELSDDGSTQYESVNFTNPSDEDIYILAEEIHLLQAETENGKKLLRTHVDVSTGPNLYPLIASLPFVRQTVAIEYSPANVRRLCALIGKTPNDDRWVEEPELREEPEPLPVYWNDWKDIAALLYDKGGAIGLDAMDANERGELMRIIKGWQYLSAEEKQTRLNTLIPNQEDNPYCRIQDLQKELRKKVTVVRGDIIDRVHGEEAEEQDARLRKNLEMDELKPYIESYKSNPIQYNALVEKLHQWDTLTDEDKDGIYKEYFRALSRRNIKHIVERKYKTAKKADISLKDITVYIGEADYLTKHSASESVSADPRVVAHYEANWIQLATVNALVCSQHMAGTQGYESFLTEEQKSISGKKRGMEELFGTSGFFKELLGTIITPFSSDKYRQGLITQTEEKVRTGYAGMVVISGRANHLKSRGLSNEELNARFARHRTPKFQNGVELLRSLAAPDAYRGDKAFTTSGAPENHAKVLRINNSFPPKPFFCTWEEFYKKDGVRDRMHEVRGGLTQSRDNMGEWEKDEVDGWDQYYEREEYQPKINAARDRFFRDGAVRLVQAREGIRSRFGENEEELFESRHNKLTQGYRSFTRHDVSIATQAERFLKEQAEAEDKRWREERRNRKVSLTR